MGNNITAMRVSLYDCDEAPALVLNQYRPVNLIRKAWVPQTMGDQIWVLYEFETKTDRETWENSVPELIKKWIVRDEYFIGQVKQYGWHIRDINGYIVG